MSKYTNVYLKKFYDLYKCSPEFVINEWKSVVKILYIGFDDFWTEYDYHLSDREPIDDILENQELLIYNDHKNFINEVSNIDNLFKLITIELNAPINSLRWFYNRIPKYIGNNYRNYFQNRYKPNIKIKPIENIDLAKEKSEVMSWNVYKSLFVFFIK